MSSSNAAIASGTSSASYPPPTAPTSQTLALRKRVETFIDAQYRVWKQQTSKKIGQLATPEVLEAVKKTSTAFHCNSTGGVDLLWLKKDMPLEALKYAEVDYWTEKAGPGPKHEQEEVMNMHGVPREAMETIRKTNDHSLIARFIYPFIDFWNLIEYHILIWIACVFFSGTICIIQPILLVCESSKITRLFFDNYLFRIYQAGLTLVVFQAFLDGHFDMPFLQAMCVITFIIIIWGELPMLPQDWLHCYGVPVIVQYGPFPEHVAILIPKQHPYRPYHTMSLAQEYVELDRHARIIIELARKIIAACPSPPLDHTRKAHLVKVRQLIVEEAARLGFLKALDDAKRQLRKKDSAFRHLALTSAYKKEKDASNAIGAPDRATEIRERAGKRAVEVRNAVAIRAIGKTGSAERIEWTAEVIDKLRRNIEDGRTTQLLACPRFMRHGTIQHAEWLIHKVTEGADVINSASGSAMFASPTTEKEKDARDILQDKAGAPRFVPNGSEQTLISGLKFLACQKPGTAQKKTIAAASCLYCRLTWLIDAQGNKALHSCPALRKWFLPRLFEDYQERLQALTEAEAALEAAKAHKPESEPDAVEEAEQSLQVTRVSNTGSIPWDLGDSITEDEDWDSVCENEPVKNRRRAKRAPALNDPLTIKALDLRGRITYLCFQIETFRSAFQLLCHPISSPLFMKEQPLPVDGIRFVHLQDYVKEQEKPLLAAGVSAAVLSKISTPSKLWLAVDSSLEATESDAILLAQAVSHFKGSKPQIQQPKVKRAEIESAYVQRIAKKDLRPFHFDWSTGTDVYQVEKDAPDDAAQASSSSNVPVVSGESELQQASKP